MQALTPREKRTVRIAAIGIAIYLCLFVAFQGWKRLEAQRTAYRKMVQDGGKLKQELQPYENKILRLQKLKDTFHIEPQKLSRATLVAQASSAIQTAATSGGVELGPIRESSARPTARELTSMQLEGNGPVPAIMAFLYRLETLGYPLVLDSIQISPGARGPGTIKVNLTIVILDFDQWKSGGTPNA